ncbi:hypothetical protein LCGC14_1538910 [marine sediment metagenome]|uniref:Cysteine--tRNA ligase n=1 Tax=marine sediment metagenome TaxID=412755 RepID=A0A0F9LUF5_9ZZZZ
MKILDTLSGAEKELESGKVRIYLCGVTVYDESHIGHARTLIVFDVLRRYLESKGMEVEFIQNFTDVDDKIINRAKRENVRASAISSRYIQEYYDEFDALNVKRATKYPKATEHIQDMLDLVQDLVDKKIAYVSKNGVYFSVSKFPEYGKLSKKKVEDLQAGARVEVDETKNDPLDFALWKFSESDPSWDSPWGRGRPGWHIECSTMSLKYLGENFEIHGGGRDLIFPHHENEIAQSCCANNGKYVNTWIHTGMVQVNKEKMSKSLDNFFTVRDVLKEYDAESVRYFLISGHYRSQLNYSQENLDQARSSLERIYTALRGVEPISCDLATNEHVTKFRKAMNDDFNTPEALPVLFELAKELNRVKDADAEQAGKLAFVLRSLGEVLGVAQQAPEAFLQGGQADDEVAHIEALIVKRNEARASKDWPAADEARDALNALGVILEDSAGKTTWRKA